MMDDHDRLRAIGKDLRLCLDGPRAEAGPHFSTLRWSLTRELLRHLALERAYFERCGVDGAEPDRTPGTASLAALDAAYRAHIGRWAAGGIDEGWDDYRRELTGLLGALDRRMAYEDAAVYPRLARQ